MGTGCSRIEDDIRLARSNEGGYIDVVETEHETVLLALR